MSNNITNDNTARGGRGAPTDLSAYKQFGDRHVRSMQMSIKMYGRSQEDAHKKALQLGPKKPKKVSKGVREVISALPAASSRRPHATILKPINAIDKPIMEATIKETPSVYIAPIKIKRGRPRKVISI